MKRRPRPRRRSQPRIPGQSREVLPSFITHAIWVEVDKIAARYGVSRSWVSAQLQAHALGIPFPYRFDRK